MVIELILWAVAALCAAGAGLSARFELDRTCRVLGATGLAAFALGGFVWLFGDTYAYYFGEKEDQLRLSYWGSYREHEMWAKIVEAFQERYPDIKVKREYITDRYEAKIQQLLVAADAPDVILFQDEPMPRFIDTGKFECLDDWCNTPGLEIRLKDDYWDTAVWSFQKGGKAYGIPIWGGDCLVIYNKAVFREAGVDDPERDWTFADFLAKCQDLTADVDKDGRTDRYGFLVPGWLYWLPFHYGFGATYLDPTRTKWTLWGHDALESFTFWQDLRHTYHVAPRRDELTESGSTAFMTGRVAMFISGPWAMPPLNEAKVDYDVAHIPIGPRGRGTRVTWDSLAMFSGSQKKDQAWKFIHFATSLPAQEIVASFQRSVPALKSAQAAYVNQNPKVHAGRFIEAFKYARLQPITVNWALMSREITSETDLLLDNRQTPKQTLRNLAANPHLSRIFQMPQLAEEAGHGH